MTRKTSKERAAERLVGDYAVKVSAQPTGNKTVKGIPSKTKIVRRGESNLRV